MTAYLIGLTGRIGTGKSTVGKMLADLGATVVDADDVTRDVMRPGQPAFSAIHGAFSGEILAPDGTIDRAKLAERVFGDPAALRRLESILHPHVVARVLDIRAGMFDDSTLVVEAIKLLESPLANACGEIWVTDAPEETMLARLRARGISEPETRLRLRQQLAADRMRARATEVVENEGDLDALRERVEVAWRRSSDRRRSRR